MKLTVNRLEKIILEEAEAVLKEQTPRPAVRDPYGRRKPSEDAAFAAAGAVFGTAKEDRVWQAFETRLRRWRLSKIEKKKYGIAGRCEGAGEMKSYYHWGRCKRVDDIQIAVLTEKCRSLGIGASKKECAEKAKAAFMEKAITRHMGGSRASARAASATGKRIGARAGPSDEARRQKAVRKLRSTGQMKWKKDMPADLVELGTYVLKNYGITITELDTTLKNSLLNTLHTEFSKGRWPGTERTQKIKRRNHAAKLPEILEWWDDARLYMEMVKEKAPTGAFVSAKKRRRDAVKGAEKAFGLGR